VSVKNFHRSARARPPPADTPDESSVVTTSQVTPSIQDFAVSLAFSGVGKADPGLAERSVARLVGLAVRANLAKAMAEKCREANPGVSTMRQAMGELSVHLSYLEEGYINAIEDWRIFHSDVVEKAERSENDLDR
jgi:hypothetical protein